MCIINQKIRAFVLYGLQSKITVIALLELNFPAESRKLSTKLFIYKSGPINISAADSGSNIG
jgi:hypothetical protein